VVGVVARPDVEVRLAIQTGHCNHVAAGAVVTQELQAHSRGNVGCFFVNGLGSGQTQEAVRGAMTEDTTKRICDWGETNFSHSSHRMNVLDPTFIDDVRVVHKRGFHGFSKNTQDIRPG
jgi:hypothetical protein